MTLQESLMARLDRLAPIKDVVQLGATIGRAFSFELMRAVSQLDEATLRRELTEVGQDLTTFSSTLGGLADRVERLERTLDAATSDLASVADAIRGPDAAVLTELQGILADIKRAGDATNLDEAVLVLEQLTAQPRDIELLLKLSQQAGALESALRIHGRLVAAGPRLQATLARLTG